MSEIICFLTTLKKKRREEPFGAYTNLQKGELKEPPPKPEKNEI